MKVLGIDPGYATMGFGVLEKKNNIIIPLDYGVIVTKPNIDMPGRLKSLTDNLSLLLEKFKPDEVAIEELFFNTNIKTAISVAQARGAIILTCVKTCPKLYEYTPLQIKQALTGYGRADKRQIQYMVRSLLSLNAVPKPDDAADALAVALCHIHTNRYTQGFKIK